MFQGTTTQQRYHERGRKTNSNIFVEEPDIFIIPGQPVKRPPRERSPEDIPLKPPPPAPPTLEGEAIEETTKLLPPPPPIPPKTYIKIKFETKQPNHNSNGNASDAVGAEPEGVHEVVVQVEPKQSNVERARIVQFHSNVKFPEEEEPPPLPMRDHVESEAVDVIRNITMETNGPILGISIEDSTRGRRELKIPLASREVEREEARRGEIEVAIVTKEGVRVGEMIPSPSSSPVADHEERIQYHSETSDDVFLSDDKIVCLQSETCVPCPTSESHC